MYILWCKIKIIPIDCNRVLQLIVLTLPNGYIYGLPGFCKIDLGQN